MLLTELPVRKYNLNLSNLGDKTRDRNELAECVNVVPLWLCCLMETVLSDCEPGKIFQYQLVRVLHECVSYSKMYFQSSILIVREIIWTARFFGTFRVYDSYVYGSSVRFPPSYADLWKSTDDHLLRSHFYINLVAYMFIWFICIRFICI